MKKFYALSTLLFTILSSVSAQEESTLKSESLEVSSEIWTPRTKQSDPTFSDNSIGAKVPPPIKPNVVNAPIDGGVLVLLGVGALYGGKRLRRTKVQKD